MELVTLLDCQFFLFYSIYTNKSILKEIYLFLKEKYL